MKYLKYENMYFNLIYARHKGCGLNDCPKIKRVIHCPLLILRKKMTNPNKFLSDLYKIQI